MRPVRAVVRALVAAVAVLAVGACTRPGPGGPPHPTPPTTNPSPTPILEWSAEGGLCPRGTCERRVTVLDNGGWGGSDGQREIDGQLDAATLRELTRRIAGGIDGLATLPPGPELCPAAYDGSNITVTFRSGPQTALVTNCHPTDPSRNRDIPGDDPLLRYAQALVTDLLRPTPPPPDKFLVEYWSRGGHCMETCPENRVRIAADGSWTGTSGPTSVNGQLDTAALHELTRRITSDLGTLRTLPRSTGCPSAYDGRDIDITFRSGGRAVTVSNCIRDFDDNALLQYTIELAEDLV